MNPETSDLWQKITRYCSYQERCHSEVKHKLKELGVNGEIREELIVKLIDENYLNEERFARTFARGKNRIKAWGKHRITNELKQRGVSQTVINLAISEIEDEYRANFEKTARKIFEQTVEKNVLKKRKKCCDYLLRRGFESEMVYEYITALEKEN
jgi:regulatory protein